MDTATYAAEAEIEQSHWWFVGRRCLFARMVQSLKLPANAVILDAGTSTGTNLRFLRSLGFTSVKGVDISPEAIRFCAEKGLGQVVHGDLGRLPFDADFFDLVLATDVIEHLDNDVEALAEIRRVLKPGGSALVTVPAFPALWGRQDEVAHHRRRYRKPGLLHACSQAGLICTQLFYFNYLLFLPIWAARRLMALCGLKPRSENDLNTKWINFLLLWLFRFDVWTAPHLRMPFGVSILAMCKKPGPGTASVRGPRQKSTESFAGAAFQ